jgi:hypothetical protein
MAIDWSELKSAEDVDPPIVTIYAGAKSGKTTLASEFPEPYYCRTGDGERAPKGIVMPSFGVSESYQDVVSQIEWMLDPESEHDRKTFILDAADGLEQLIRVEACSRNGWANIEEPGFGKGYAAELAIWHEFVKLCLKMKRAGYYVVLIAHVKAKTVPGVTTDSYPRYMPNLRDDAVGVIVDASDLIGFLHQRVSIKKEDAGFKKTNNRGEGGGDLVIAVQERPGFIAGNRYDIPTPTVPFKKGAGFAALAQYFPAQAEAEEVDEAA